MSTSQVSHSVEHSDFNQWLEIAAALTPEQRDELKGTLLPLSRGECGQLNEDTMYKIGLQQEVALLQTMPEAERTRELLARFVVLGTIRAHPSDIMSKDGTESDLSASFELIILKAQAAESFSVADGFPLHMLDDFKTVDPTVLEHLKSHKMQSDTNLPFTLAKVNVTPELVHKFTDAYRPENQTSPPSGALDLAFLIDGITDNVVNVGLPLTERAQSYKRFIEQTYEFASKVDNALFKARLTSVLGART